MSSADQLPHARARAPRLTPLQWLLVALAAGLLGFAFRVPIDWMVDRWRAAESYYSHGFLVPLVAGYIIWRERALLAKLPAGGHGIGLALLLLGIVAYVFSGLLVIFFTASFALILVLWGLGGFLFGWPVMRRTWFPAFLLLFMVPLPLQVIAEISLKMKLFAAEAAIRLIGLFGVMTIREGSTIYLGDAVVTVGNACSGLRSLISLIFLGVLFAYLTPLPVTRKIVLFLASFPIAIIANIVRVFMLCIIAYNWGNRAITPFVHDLSGYSIFVVAFALLWGTVRLLGLGLPPEAPGPPGDDAQPAPALALKGDDHA